jgi:microcystin-dependent protein
MSEPFLGEIRMFGFGFAPRGWALCNGQSLPINQFQALFALLGTTYGGNGQTTFELPNLVGRVPLHSGQGIGLSPIVLGQSSGAVTVVLHPAEMPGHAHTLSASTDVAVATSPAAAALAKKPRFGADVFGAPGATAALNPRSLANTGGGQAHENMQPYLVVSFAIALQGIFPSRN